MYSEIPFRVALVVVIALTMSVTVYHRLQAAKSGETISRKEEGMRLRHHAPTCWTLPLDRHVRVFAVPRLFSVGISPTAR
jgi:hypothetical protein